METQPTGLESQGFHRYTVTYFHPQCGAYIEVDVQQPSNKLVISSSPLIAALEHGVCPATRKRHNPDDFQVISVVMKD